MPILHIPFAIDDEERLNSPTTAEKGRGYFCPVCRGPVILKHGEIRTPHFAHKVSDICNQETITHKTAKLLIQKAVHEWKLGKSKSPELQRAGQICGKFTIQPLPKKVDNAVLEYKLSDGSIADVALLSGDIAQAAVEIKITHSVTETKADSLPVPFVELDGYEVIENPAIWRPITSTFKPLTCDKCKSNYLNFQKKARAFAEANNLELPKRYYRYGFRKCWKCKREIIVFTWPQHGIWDDCAPKVKPSPPTIQYQFSKELRRKYWGNTCPYCKILQGDWFRGNPDNPLLVVGDIEEDSPVAFDRDMMKIANYAVQLELYTTPTPTQTPPPPS